MAKNYVKEQVDILPALLVLFLLLVLFFLLRPPALMFWRYGLGMGKYASAQTDERAYSGLPTSSLAVDKIKPPPLPMSLMQVSMPTVPQRKSDDAALDREIERLVLEERRSEKRGHLIVDPVLSDIAERHSWDMLTQNYMDHISPDGAGPSQRVGKQHRRLFGLIGENVGGLESSPNSTPSVANDFMEIWLNSLEHRRNILSSEYTHTGVGCYEKLEAGNIKEIHLCTQLFAKAFAWSENDILAGNSPNGRLFVSIRPESGFLPPSKLIQVNLQNGREMSFVTLLDRGGAAQGELVLAGEKGIFGLHIHISKRENPNRYWIIPGPYILIQ